MNKLREVWFSFPVERRRALIIGMAELAKMTLTAFESAGKLGLDDTDDDVVVAAIDLLFEADDKRLIKRYLTFLRDNSRKENLRARCCQRPGALLLQMRAQRT